MEGTENRHGLREKFKRVSYNVKKRRKKERIFKKRCH